MRTEGFQSDHLARRLLIGGSDRGFKGDGSLGRQASIVLGLGVLIGGNQLSDLIRTYRASELEVGGRNLSLKFKIVLYAQCGSP